VIEDVRSATKGIARTQPSDADFLCQLVDSVVKDWDSIGHWNAHATATPVGDVIEYDMFKRSVGNRDIPISSLKGRIGHTMSNSGLCEMIHGIMSFQQKKVFKTHNLVDPFVDDPRIIMEDVSTTKDTFLKCSFGFSGKNSVVLVKCL
jgi:3-oxoacyl-(acyl-carrier-protein) synthase